MGIVFKREGKGSERSERGRLKERGKETGRCYTTGYENRQRGPRKLERTRNGFPLAPPEGTQQCWRLDFSPPRLTWDSDFCIYSVMDLCYFKWLFVVFCCGGGRKVACPPPMAIPILNVGYSFCLRLPTHQTFPHFCLPCFLNSLLSPHPLP